MTQAVCNISTNPEKPNIAADPLGAVLILSGPPGETGSAPAILLRSDGTAAALHAITGADGVWSLSGPIERLTPQKVRDCFLGMTAIRREAANEIERAGEAAKMQAIAERIRRRLNPESVDVLESAALEQINRYSGLDWVRAALDRAKEAA